MRRIMIGLSSAVLVATLLVFTGCSKSGRSEGDTAAGKGSEAVTDISQPLESSFEDSVPEDTIAAETPASPQIDEVDYGTYFGDVEGSAVFYTPQLYRYEFYRQDLAEQRYSPCSTFKIVSALAALESGVISADNSTRPWNGEQFWKEDWNRDIGLRDAFQASCVWYFRTLINEMGKEKMQSFVNDLVYGNEDISDWEGHLNKNNNNRLLTGFWVESSLKISPKEQVEVLSRIFDDNSLYNQAYVDLLGDMMVVSQDVTDIVIHGKTGYGKLGNVSVDSWFVGFYESESDPTYFAVHLNATDNPKVSSSLAKEIAIQIIDKRK